MTEFLTIIFLLAGLQGVLLFILLFNRKQNHSANLILGVSILILSFDLFLSAAFINQLYLQFPHLLGISYAFPFLYGPLFYLYIRALTAIDQKPDKKKLLHFIPFLFVVVYMIPDYLLGGEAKIKFVQGLAVKEPLSYALFNHLKPVHGMIYTILTIKIVKAHNLRIKDSFSNIDKVNLVWLKNLVAGLVVIWSIVVLTFIMDDFVKINFAGYDSLISLAISVMVYSIGYMGLKQPDIFTQCRDNCQNILVTKTELRQRHRKSGLPESRYQEISARLLNLMETEKPYLNSELTLRDLADRLDVSQNNLSEVIKTKLGQTFFDFVNRYRVEEFKKKLETPESFNFNLLTIAIDSGFDSKTSFNVVFKNFTQMTPSQYRAMLKDNLQSSESVA